MKECEIHLFPWLYSTLSFASGCGEPQIDSDFANGSASLLASFPKGSTVHQSSDYKGKAEGSKNNRYMAFLLTLWFDVTENVPTWAGISEVLGVKQ